MENSMAEVRTKFITPWHDIESNGLLEAQLYKEVGPDHELYGKKVIAIARSWYDPNAVLFNLTEYPEIYAEVCLTWKKKPGSNAVWPYTKAYKCFDDWVKDRMIPAHEDEFINPKNGGDRTSSYREYLATGTYSDRPRKKGEKSSRIMVFLYFVIFVFLRYLTIVSGDK